jgi:hypothetical protein
LYGRDTQARVLRESSKQFQRNARKPFHWRRMKRTGRIFLVIILGMKSCIAIERLRLLVGGLPSTAILFPMKITCRLSSLEESLC